MGEFENDLERELARAEALSGTEPRSALSVLEVVLSPELRRNHPELAARAGYLRARLLADQGEYQQALGAIRAARRDWLAAGATLDAIRTDLGRATVLIELGEYQQAVDVSERLLEKLDELPAGRSAEMQRSIRAGAFGNLGNARNLMGDHTGAVGDYDVSSNLYHGLGERTKQAEMDANRAIAFMRLGMVHRAVDDLQRSHEVLLEHGLIRPATKCLIDMADGELLLGEPLSALGRLEDASIELERMNAFPEMARLRVIRAEALLQMGLYSDAHIQASAAGEVFTDLNMMSESARAARVCGTASMEAGDLKAAAEELAVAERLFEACGEQGNVARVWLVQARLDAFQGRRAEGRAKVEAALEHLDGSSRSIYTAQAHLDLAGFVDDAELVERHIAAASELIDNFDLGGLRLAREAAVARLQRLDGDLHAAAETLTEALITDRARIAASGRFEFHIGAESITSSMTADLIRVLIEIGTSASLAKAWQASTMVKTVVLDQVLASDVSALGSDTKRDPMVGLSMMYDDLRELPHGRERAALDRLIRTKQRFLLRQGLISQAEQIVTREVSLPPVPETAILQFHVVGPDIVVFVLREGGVEARVLPDASADSLGLVREWRAECSRMRSVNGGAGAIEPVSGVDLMHAFYKTLIEPVDDLLDGLDGEPLRIVAHQHLFGVPFEALDCDGVPMSQRYSLYFAVGTASGQEKVAPDVAGLAVFAAPDDVAPQIEDEAREIGEIVPGADVFIGEAATADAFTVHAPGKDIVHLACHGEFRDESPIFSGLRLADRWVTGVEIMGLDLAGTMAVLSACDAGRSSDAHVEPMGIVWALIGAGCRSVIASKWTVDDAVGRLFMTVLHRHLASGVHARLAVEVARREIAAAFPHPYYWAAFRYICSPTTALLEEEYTWNS